MPASQGSQVALPAAAAAVPAAQSTQEPPAAEMAPAAQSAQVADPAVLYFPAAQAAQPPQRSQDESQLSSPSHS